MDLKKVHELSRFPVLKSEGHFGVCAMTRGGLRMESQANLSQVVAGVEVTVEYLPAAKPFHKEYPESTTIGTVRTDAMAFFGVSDHRDRDTHQFFLEFNGTRLTDMTQTLAQLLGPHRKGAHFNLVEQITPGGFVSYE
jgi:hypothetical protein